MSGWYAPGTPASGSTPGSPSRTTAGTLGSTSAMASMDDWIPLPMAVRRPVVRLRIASATSARSAVGTSSTAAKPLNATRPIRVPAGWPSTNAMAAFWAASSRVGSMSVEHMLPETSIARTIVDWLLGTERTTVGRATAMASAATAAATRATGTCRRNRRGEGPAARMSDRLE